MKRPFVALTVAAALAVALPAFSGDKAPKGAPTPPTPTAVAPAAPAAAAPSPEKAVKYRETVMMAAAKHMGAMSMIVKGEVDRKQDLQANADALAAIAPTIPALFGPGTGPDKVKSEAKPEVWTKFADFEAANLKFVEATKKLSEVAKTGDFEAFKTQFGEVGKTCGGCHETFRVEDEH